MIGAHEAEAGTFRLILATGDAAGHVQLLARCRATALAHTGSRAIGFAAAHSCGNGVGEVFYEGTKDIRVLWGSGHNTLIYLDWMLRHYSTIQAYLTI